MDKDDSMNKLTSSELVNADDRALQTKSQTTEMTIKKHRIIIDDDVPNKSSIKNNSYDENRCESSTGRGTHNVSKATHDEQKATDGEIKETDSETKATDDEREAKDDETKAKDDETKAKDDETKEKDDETKAKDDETKAKDDETKAKDDETKEKDDETKAKDDETKATDDEREAKDDEREANDDKTKAKDDETKAKDDETIAKDGEPKAKDGEPKANDDKTKAKDDETKAKDGEPKATHNKAKETREKSIKTIISDTETKLKRIIKLENDFVAGLGKVFNIYSPIEDFNETESNDVIQFFESKLLEIIKLKKINDKSVKVALFGDVSSGKSQTINCILGRNLFIPSYCLSTVCFVEIKLSTDGESDTIKLPNGEIIKCETPDAMRATVNEYSNYNGQFKLESHDILKISVNTRDTNNKIMRENVTLIDCPGGNDNQEVTDMIEHVVVEADIFLCIITQVIFKQQREFFKEILTKTDMSNIFVLVNKWDETDDDDDADTDNARECLRSQVSTWLTGIDSDNTDICSDRIFFISAKETLENKTHQTDPATLTNKQILRMKEFERFETIFGAHLDNENIKKIKNIKSNCDDRITKLRERVQTYADRVQTKMDKLDQVQDNLYSESEKKINKLSPDKYGRFYKQKLKLIAREMGKFMDNDSTDVSEKKEIKKTSWFGTAKNVYGTAKNAIGTATGDSNHESPEQLKKKIKSYIEREVEIITEPLQRELNYYINYVSNDIFNC